MFEFIRSWLRGRHAQAQPYPVTHITTADVFTTAQPTVNYVSRSGVERILAEELNRRDRIVCVTGASKSGKTVVVKTLLPQAPIVGGQVSLQSDQVWKTLCAAKRIPLRTSDRAKGSVDATAGLLKAGVEREAHSEVDIDPRTAFLDYCRDEKRIIFDDFHYFQKDTQREFFPAQWDPKLGIHVT